MNVDIISFLTLFNSLRMCVEIKFAEDPEFTKVLYFTPSHLDHFFSINVSHLSSLLKDSSMII